MVAGGSNFEIMKSAELYNPATGRWTATGSMNVERIGFKMIRVAGNRVLAVGGLDAYGALKYAELYDAGTGVWRRVNDLRARVDPLAVRLGNGAVLVAGGWDNKVAWRSSDIFKPS